jgi:hypothetical protein
MSSLWQKLKRAEAKLAAKKIRAGLEKKAKMLMLSPWAKMANNEQELSHMAALR